MKRFITVLLLLISFSLQAQDIYYYDKHWWPAKASDNYVYKRVATKVKKNIYSVTEYKNGNVFFTGTYSTPEAELLKDYRSTLFRTDTFIYYHDNGTIAQKGCYVNGLKTGIWNSYYDDGVLLSMSHHDASSIINTRKSYKYNKEGVIISSIEYKDGKTTLIECADNGELILKRIIQDGEIISEEKNEDYVSVEEPIYEEIHPEPEYDAYQYLNENIKYPKSCMKNRISGRVLVKFNLDTDGYIMNVASASPEVDMALQLEAIRVVQNMPPWKPGYQNGKPVEVFYTLPVSFSTR